MKELIVPPAVTSDPSARELARVWASGGRQHVSLAAGIWPDPGAWGIMLVDLARHVENVYQQTKGLDNGEVLVRIREAFEAEWNHPTDSPKGSVD